MAPTIDEAERSFSGKRVLITGAAGFLGSHLCLRLSKAGASVTGADNLSVARPDWASLASQNGFETVPLDIRHGEEVRRGMAERSPEVVFHLAAVANPRACKQDFPLAFDVNVVGLENILRHAPATSRVVFMSSAAVYGAPERLPIDEGHPRKGSDPYSVTKIIGEDLAGSYKRNYGRSVAIVRNFNTFGVGQAGDYIVPQLIRQALTEGRMELWDPSTVRDLMYIDDTIDALVQVAASEDAGPINLGTGRGTTVGDLAAMIGRKVGGSLPIVDLKKKVVGSPALVSDNGRLQRLGWSERVGFEQGVDRTITWSRAQLAGAKA